MARLRRTDCSAPGLLRRRAGKGFVYVDATGQRVVDRATLERIRSLAIPPAWVDVWICPWPNGHIQALGTDARGRRQYRYHDAWRVARDREKFDHMLDAALVFPAVRRQCAADLSLPGMPRERVLAGAVRLLDLGLFRVGGEEYTEENGSFGLATLLRSHVRVNGREVVFEYPSKSGRHRLISVADPDALELVAALKRRRSGGPELLAYRDERGRWIDVRSQHINDYLRAASDPQLTAKDFRTWNATVLAAVSLARAWEPRTSLPARRRAVSSAIREVAEYLGNTPAVCRSSYVDPRVIDRFYAGESIAAVVEDIDLADLTPTSPAAVRQRIEEAVIGMLSTDEAVQAA